MASTAVDNMKDVHASTGKASRDNRAARGGMRGAESENDFDDFFIGKFESKIFPNDQVFDLAGFIGRNLSASYALKENDENYHRSGTQHLSDKA